MIWPTQFLARCGRRSLSSTKLGCRIFKLHNYYVHVCKIILIVTCTCICNFVVYILFFFHQLCASVEAYSFLIEVYCIIWRHSKLQLSVLVGYDLMDTILHHLQHLLHWTTHYDTDSASKNKVIMLTV